MAVAERLLAIQAQDWRELLLAVRARSQGLTAAEVIQVITGDRILLVSWLNRGTLHLVLSEDYSRVLALTPPPRMGAAFARLAREGVTPDGAERGVSAISAALLQEGPLTRAQLGERQATKGLAAPSPELLQLLFLASLRGKIVRGPMVGKTQAFVLVRDWIGSPSRASREMSLVQLARRYLVGHAPANDRDLAQWAGIPLRDSRAGVRGLGSELRQRPDGLLELGSRRLRSALPRPRLLVPFDPLLLGWKSREPVLGSHRGVVYRERSLPTHRTRGQPCRWNLAARRRNADAAAVRSPDQFGAPGAGS
ncbi:MAG: DNA glycosylase AlkZ-like family protein [Candidatus Dormibacteria bacterium]